MSYYMNTGVTKSVGGQAQDIANQLEALMKDNDTQITRGHTEGLKGLMSSALRTAKEEVLPGMHKIDKQLASGGAAFVHVANNTEEAAQQVAGLIKTI